MTAQRIKPGYINASNTTSGQVLTSNGSATYWANAAVDSNGSYTFSNTVTFEQVTEVLNTKTGATGTVEHDYATGSTFLHSSIAANFTANFTNIPTTDNRVTSLALILNQGATGYYANAIQINGSSQTIKWYANSAPVANTNRIEIQTVTLIRSGSAWTVLSSLNPYA